MIFLTPTYRPVGGVVKIFDYVTHARSLGFAVEIRCGDRYEPDLPLFGIDRFASLTKDPEVTFSAGFRFGIGTEDYVFFSWPTHHEHIASRITPVHHPEQTILIVQNVRWANPTFAGGYALRLLGRPMARIMITEEVEKVTAPFVHPTTLTRVIVEGHDWPYFAKQRSGGLPQAVNVAYTTWKSDAGIAVEDSLEADERFSFRSIRWTAGWDELRELYHWADIFLGFPGPEEGFYLPGLEAMAAGCLVIMADAGGNRAYADFGVNCLEAEFDSAASYRNALDELMSTPEGDIAAMRDRGYAVLDAHLLSREREEFGALVAELDRRVGLAAARTSPPA